MMWRDRMHFLLAPDKVSVVRFARGFKPSVIQSKSLVCDAPAPSEPAWQPALRAMQKMLPDAANKVDVAVTLSSQFVRYLLVAAQADLADDAEEEAYVRFCFSEVYGADAAQWALRWGSALAVDAQIACGVDSAFLAALDEIAQAKGTHLCAMQPYLMTAFNLLRDKMSDTQQCFALVEQGSVCIAAFANGACTMLRSVRLDAQWQTNLPKILTRELLMAEANQAGDLLLCAPQHVDLSTLSQSGWKVRQVNISANALLQGKLLPTSVAGGFIARA